MVGVVAASRGGAGAGTTGGARNVNFRGGCGDVRRRSGHRGQPTTLSRTLWMILLLLCVAGSTSAVSIASRQKMMLEREAARRRTAMGGRGGALPGKCEEAWFTQDVDHFGWGSANGSTWEQRYFLCESNEYRAPSPGVPRPIFFYVGNEANVELYVNATGLMWENAGEMGALMVFAEHRYYGKSWPFGSEQASTTRAHLRFLTHEQALADYANLITSLKQRLSLVASPVVAFGGSYGGMLAAWFRQKYPHIIVGAVAASAPVLAFGSWDSSKYWAAVTRDYTPDGGCSATCAQRIRSAWTPLFQMGETAEGLEDMSRLFRMCNPLSDADEAGQLALMLAMALDTTAMGNFPYPSTYVSDPNSPLPAWPVRSACAAMDVADPDDPISLLSGLRDAASVFYNSSGSLSCLELPDDQSYAGIWDYQWCTEALPQESYFKRTGEGDMFYEFSLSTTQIDAHCRDKYGVSQRRGWIEQQYGGIEGLKASSNIILSNGGMDPWSSGGVLKSVSDTVVAFWIPEGAHHLDLFFSHPDDPLSVRRVRAAEVALIKEWVSQGKDGGATDQGKTSFVNQ